MTQTRTDERICALIDECGMEGYGFYWSVLEIVANVMDKTDRCEVTYSLTKWSSMLLLHHHKVRYLLGKLEVTGLMQCRSVGSNWTVKIPNLLKYRDEWASRKLTTRELLGSDSGVTREQDTDTETQTELKALEFLNRNSLSGKPDDASLSKKKSTQNLEYKNQAIEVLNFLNEKVGKNYRPVETNLKFIIARLKSGASVQDCFCIIAKKRREWIGNPDMCDYLRPATLFNATKFEQYLGELIPDGDE